MHLDYAFPAHHDCAVQDHLPGPDQPACESATRYSHDRWQVNVMVRSRLCVDMDQPE